MKNDEFKTTTNNSVYKKYYKMKYASCSFCPWHRIENATHTVRRSWKKYRRTQYKIN
jgi:hypothetical protein